MIIFIGGHGPLAGSHLFKVFMDEITTLYNKKDGLPPDAAYPDCIFLSIISPENGEFSGNFDFDEDMLYEHIDCWPHDDIVVVPLCVSITKKIRDMGVNVFGMDKFINDIAQKGDVIGCSHHVTSNKLLGDNHKYCDMSPIIENPWSDVSNYIPERGSLILGCTELSLTDWSNYDNVKDAPTLFMKTLAERCVYW